MAEPHGSVVLLRARNVLVVTAPMVAYFGLRLQRPVLVALGAVIFATIVLAFALGAYQISRVEVRRRIGSGAFEDDPVTVELLVVNRGLLPLYLFTVEDRFPPAEYSYKRLHVASPLPGQTATQLAYNARCSKRRGGYQVGPVRIGLRDPLGLFEHSRTLSVHDRFLVYPGTVPLGLRLAGTSTRQAARLVSPAYTGSSAAFHGTREYRIGDEPRTIHWPSTARHGKPIVAEYDREVARTCAIVLDLQQAHRAGLGQRSVLETSVKLAASVAREAIDERALVELICNDHRQRLVGGGAGKRQLLRILATLVEVKQSGTLSLATCVARHLPRLPPRCAPLIIASSLAVDEALLHELGAHVRQRRAELIVLLLDHSAFLQHEHLRPAEEAHAAASALQAVGARVHLISELDAIAEQLLTPWLPPQAELADEAPNAPEAA